ncbi:Lrp/AsnC family transcriptional regulator [Siccirubricoccus deserti]
MIKGYVAILDQQSLGLPDTVIIEVMMERHDEESLRRFEQAVTEMPEVIEAWLVTGEYDYVIKAAVGGTAGYERLLREKLYRLPGVRHTRTSFTLRSLKQSWTPAPSRAPARAGCSSPSCVDLLRASSCAGASGLGMAGRAGA